MIAFLLSPLGRKIALYAGIAVALFFTYRWWSNALVEKGRQQGRTEQMKADAKLLEQQSAAAQAEIERFKQALAVSQSQNAQERASLRRIRGDMDKGLDEALAKVRASQEVCNVSIAAIPDAELSDAIRAQLARLRAGQTDGAAHAAGTP